MLDLLLGLLYLGDKPEVDIAVEPIPLILLLGCEYWEELWEELREELRGEWCRW